MSYALQLLIGGTLFIGIQATLGAPAVLLAAAVLFALELVHDLQRYGPDRRKAYRRWDDWERAEAPSVTPPLDR